MRQVFYIIFISVFLPFTIFADDHSYFTENINLLQKYDFEKGGFSIVGTIWHGQRHELQKALGDFYVDDVQVLKELQKKWVTEKRSPFYKCGYHYRVFIIEDRKERESFLINVEKGCNTVVTDYGSFYFDPFKISSFKEKLRNPIIKQEHFEFYQEGRDYLQSLSENENFLLYLKPDWIDHDGEFYFVAECQEIGFRSSVVQECLSNIKERISSKYPGLNYNLKHTGAVFGKLLIKMECNEEFYNRFSLYEIYTEYKPYPLELTVYFKSM